MPTEKTPSIFALVNPHLEKNCREDLKNLSAGGVTFLFLVGVNRLCNSKFDLLNLLDLVALSTVCDVMPLQGLNRAFVKQGIRVLQETKNLGIQALCKIACLKNIQSAYDLGFVIGPRINAGGRLGQSYLGVQILTTEDPIKAAALADILNQLNQERQKLEEEILANAIKRVRDEKLDQFSCIVLHDPNWHAGLLGIIAARIREMYEKPTFIAGAEENGVMMGSSRSTDNVHIGNLLQKALIANLLISGGGHAKAGGFKCSITALPDFYKFLNQELAQNIFEPEPNGIYIKRSLSGIDRNLLDMITCLEPFGVGHEEPIIAITDIQIKAPSLVKDQHIKCYLIDSLGHTLPAISFRALRLGLKESLFNPSSIYTCIGYLKNSPYGLQFQIFDLIPQEHKNNQ